MPFFPSLPGARGARATLALMSIALGASALFAPPALAAPPAKLTVSFHNADASDVLRAIAMQSGLSIAVTPSVKGKIISVRLKDVTATEALQIVAEAAGITYRRNGNSYVMGTSEELKKPRAASALQTYSLQHLAPAAARSLLDISAPYVTTALVEGARQITLTGSESEVRQAVAVLRGADIPQAPVSQVLTPKFVTAQFLADVTRRASIPGLQIETMENVVVVTGSPEAVAQVRTLMPAIDTAEGLASRVEVYRVRYSSADALATMLRTAVPGLTATPTAEPYAPPAATFQPISGSAVSGVAGGLGGGGGAGAANANGGAGGLGVTGAAGALGANGGFAAGPKARQIVLSGSDAVVTRALDLLRQIDVAPTQVEIVARIMDVARSNDFDLGVQWGTGILKEDGTTTFSQGISGFTEAEGAVPTGIIRFGRFTRSPLDFAAQLRFLEVKNRAKTLANPRISAIDNEEASIFIGEVRRFQVLAAQSATAGNAFTVVEIPVGVTLLVRPRVNESGDITLKIHPAVSSLSGFVGDLPQTNTREADTTLRMRDGETVVIGGLLRDDEIKSLEQVPLIGNIPLFGELFRRRKNTKVQSEVVIFLTARLLPEPVSPALPAPAVPLVPGAPGASPTPVPQVGVKTALAASASSSKEAVKP